MSNFRDEIQKTQASYPVVWRYGSTEDIGDTALKQFQVDVQTPVGLTRKNILVAGSAGGCLRYVLVSFLELLVFMDVQNWTMKLYVFPFIEELVELFKLFAGQLICFGSFFLQHSKSFQR
jgi:hypothetical protein